MSTAPDKDENDKSKTPEKTRLQALKDKAKDEQFQPRMPPLECGDYLISHLWAVGPTMSGSMGAGPLTHTELESYQRNIGVELSEWEISTLRRLSNEYLSESFNAKARDCKAPWEPEEIVVDHLFVAKDLEAEMMRLAEM